MESKLLLSFFFLWQFFMGVSNLCFLLFIRSAALDGQDIRGDRI